MNGAVVVDASTIVKWVVPEALSDQAEQLYLDSVGQQLAVVGPPHLLGEACNAVLQRWRTTDPDKHLTEIEVDRAAAGLLRHAVDSRNPRGLYSRAVTFARHEALVTVYDSLYVVLAQMLGAELWTADRRLIRQVAGVAPWVRWLGDYPLPSTTTEAH
jgi:predicted nucleic acid-binding protein